MREQKKGGYTIQADLAITLETGDVLFQIVFPEGGDSSRLFLLEMLSPFVEMIPLKNWIPVPRMRQLLFLPEKIQLPENLFLSKETTVIVSSESTNQLEALSQTPAQVLACGLSSKDTVTFSSRKETRAAVSLLREIRGWDGRIVEPMDIPLDIPENCGDYLILAAAASAVYLGIPPENFRKFTSYKKSRPVYNTKANANQPIIKKENLKECNDYV